MAYYILSSINGLLCLGYMCGSRYIKINLSDSENRITAMKSRELQTSRQLDPSHALLALVLIRLPKA